MKKLFVMAIVCLFSAISTGKADTQVIYDTTLVDSPAVMADTNYDIDIKRVGIDWLSVQGIWSKNAYPAITFTDGVYSKGTITVSTTTSVAGSTITIASTQYAEGIHWDVASTSSGTASNIYDILVATYTPFGGTSATGSLIVGSTIGMTLSSFTVYGLPFVQGRDWFVTNTTTGIAQSIYSILSSSFSGVMVSSRSASTVNLTYTARVSTANVAIASYTSSIAVSGMTGGVNWKHLTMFSQTVNFSRGSTAAVIYATATAIGSAYDYTFAASTVAIAVVGMTGGDLSDISGVNDYIAKSSTYPVALPLLLTVSSGTLPTGLTAGTTYYANFYGSGRYFLKLSTTVALANAGYGVPITTSAASTDGSFTLTPIDLQAGTNYGIVWKASNDNSTWYDMVATSVTISTTTYSGNLFWDFGFTTYRYIRAAFSAGTFGAIRLKLHGYGKR